MNRQTAVEKSLNAATRSMPRNAAENRTRLLDALRISLVIALTGGMGACTVVPAYPVGYTAPPAYGPVYPAYRYPGATIYYEPGYHHHDHPRGYPYGEPRRIDSPFEGAARLHRDTRRSLGLPRLPGMP